MSRVELAQEVVYALLVCRILSSDVVHQDLDAGFLVVPAKPKVGFTHVATVEVLLCLGKVGRILSGLVEPGSSPSKFVFVATP